MLIDLYNYLTNLPRLHIFLIFTIGYLVYYLIEVVKRPILAVKKGPFKDYLLKYVPTLELKFWPTWWCVESRAQTVFASIIRSNLLPNIDYKREILQLKDGGEVALDWKESDCEKDSPIIIILPGLTGESQAEYIKCLVTAANQIGIRCCVFNNRGLGGIALKTPRLYCAANCEDLSEVVNYVYKNHPNVLIAATGKTIIILVCSYLCELLKEFDSYFTSKHFGYNDVDCYYSAATLHNKLHKIRVPTLCLSAADDPFQPLDAIPIKAAESSSHVAIVITARGGHIGFLEGWWPANKDQYISRLFSQFFAAVLFDKDCEFLRIAEEISKDVKEE
ncbi:unnamed protein product [Diamesa serratosioi]